MAILIAALVFGVMILFHELGHFLVAKWTGTNVLEFSIGMGPKLFSKQGKNTLYSLRLFPIGGYCALEGEDGTEDYSAGAFNYKPHWQRFLILFAGSFMNLLLGLLISMGLVIASPAIATTTVAKFEPTALSVQTGLRTGDQILKINGSRVYTATDVGFLLVDAGTKPVQMAVMRNGEKVTLSHITFPDDGKTQRTDFYFAAEKKTPLRVLEYGTMRAFSFCRVVWKSLFAMLTGKVALSELSGPVGTTVALGAAASAGMETFAFFVMFFTINLGLLNLLPLPALDGGRIAFLAVEKVTRRPVSKNVESLCNFIGFALLMLLMLAVTFQDILRLVFKS